MKTNYKFGKHHLAISVHNSLVTPNQPGHSAWGIVFSKLETVRKLKGLRYFLEIEKIETVSICFSYISALIHMAKFRIKLKVKFNTNRYSESQRTGIVQPSFTLAGCPSMAKLPFLSGFKFWQLYNDWLIEPSETVCTHSILIENDLKYSHTNSAPTLYRLVSIPVFPNFWIYVNVPILQNQAMLNQTNICLDNYPENNILVVLINPLLGEGFTPLPYSSNTV